MWSLIASQLDKRLSKASVDAAALLAVSAVACTTLIIVGSHGTAIPGDSPRDAVAAITAWFGYPDPDWLRNGMQWLLDPMRRPLIGLLPWFAGVLLALRQQVTVAWLLLLVTWEVLGARQAFIPAAVMICVASVLALRTIGDEVPGEQDMKVSLLHWAMAVRDSVTNALAPVLLPVAVLDSIPELFYPRYLTRAECRTASRTTEE